MEYTQSIGDMFETYTGTPEEIAKLIELKDNQDNNAVTQSISLTGQVDLDKVVEEIAKEIKDELKSMITINF